MKMKGATCVALALLMTLFFAGCKDNSPVDEPLPSTPPTPTVTAGDTFLSSGFKIRSEIKIKNSVSTDPIIFEVYVDSEGDGEGLVGYQDNVYDVYLVADQIYVRLTEDIVVRISDVSAHMVPNDIGLIGNNDLRSSGFSLLDGRVVSYTGGNASVDMVSKYESSVSTFEPVAVTQANNMSTSDLLKYFFESKSTVYTEQPPATEPDVERQSYYVNSAYGLTIHDVVYSIGDYCEPYTYFEELTPQGMNEQSQYNQDEKITFVYVTYLSSDGSSMFMTTDGYVQAISTTSNFVFLDEIRRGMSKDSLEALLGIGLKKAEQATFVPIRSGMTAAKSGNNYVVYLGDLTIELIMNAKAKVLAGITVSNYLDFRG